MKAKLTNKHALYLDQAPASTGAVTRHDPHWTPGTWGSWLLDDTDRLVPNSQFQLGFGDFNEAYKRTAYEQSVAVLRGVSGADGLIPFENLQWSPSPR